MKTMYHATTIENAESIIVSGLKRNQIEHVVFLCEEPEHCARFLAIRGIMNFVVMPVKVHEKFLQESFDHSESFFKCKAYMYSKDIPVRNIDIDNILEYDLRSR